MGPFEWADDSDRHVVDSAGHCAAPLEGVFRKRCGPERAWPRTVYKNQFHY